LRSVRAFPSAEESERVIKLVDSALPDRRLGLNVDDSTLCATTTTGERRAGLTVGGIGASTGRGAGGCSDSTALDSANGLQAIASAMTMKRVLSDFMARILATY